MNLRPYFVMWACSVVAAFGLALYRRLPGKKREDDRPQRILTIIVVIGGLLLAATFLYELWQPGVKPVA
ncbi:MAG TPA: hypothetical protein VKU01_15815 [Bryobacteraceae bacterium]|nr:hypothetical protein [Bryobacteraceae bacterium]